MATYSLELVGLTYPQSRGHVYMVEPMLTDKVLTAALRSLQMRPIQFGCCPRIRNQVELPFVHHK